MRTLEEVFRANLKRLRGSRSQDAIAETAKIPKRTYQHAEAGAIPQGPTRQAIAAAFGVPEASLFLDETLIPQSDAGDLRELLRLTAALNDSQVARYLAMMRAEVPSSSGEHEGDSDESASESGEGDASGT